MSLKGASFESHINPCPCLHKKIPVLLKLKIFNLFSSFFLIGKTDFFCAIKTSRLFVTTPRNHFSLIDAHQLLLGIAIKSVWKLSLTVTGQTDRQKQTKQSNRESRESRSFEHTMSTMAHQTKGVSIPFIDILMQERNPKNATYCLISLE